MQLRMLSVMLLSRDNHVTRAWDILKLWRILIRASHENRQKGRELGSKPFVYWAILGPRHFSWLFWFDIQMMDLVGVMFLI